MAISLLVHLRCRDTACLETRWMLPPGCNPLEKVLHAPNVLHAQNWYCMIQLPCKSGVFACKSAMNATSFSCRGESLLANFIHHLLCFFIALGSSSVGSSASATFTGLESMTWEDKSGIISSSSSLSLDLSSHFSMDSFSRCVWSTLFLQSSSKSSGRSLSGKPSIFTTFWWILSEWSLCLKGKNVDDRNWPS